MENMHTQIGDGYPRFIKNIADGQDNFPEKAHEKLAGAISELIQKKETKSKIIGLEGQWGAGKSNVIRMIQSKLEKTHQVYIHDVWSFQEDLQRRSFLESLTYELCASQENGQSTFISNKEKWNDKLKELLARKKETTTDVIPVFSPGFIFVIAFVVLWTIAGDFSGPIYLDGTEIHKRAWVLMLGLIGYVFFCYRAKSWLGPKDIFYLYSEKDTKRVTNETTFEEEPSPHRFNKWISELQADFPKEKELIVVFDNMDRLPKDKIAQMWSLIHTFFSEKYFEKIWVIVPYSREHIIKVFTDAEETDHFIDKTFTIQYLVSPPILSDWKAFFNNVYKESYGETEDEELSVVRSIFDRLTPRITPRKIIIFMNETVALKKMWQKDNMPLRYIALFILTKRKILDDPAGKILSKSFTAGCENIFAKDSKLQDFISALTYNIPPSSAGQVVLKQELKIVLQDGRVQKNKINTFATQPFFLDLLESVLFEEQDTRGYAECLNSIFDELYVKLDSSRMNDVWYQLAQNYLATPIVSQEFNEVDKIFLMRISNNIKQSFIDQVIARLDLIDEAKFSGFEYARTMKNIQDYVRDLNLKVEIHPNLTNPVKSPHIFVQYLLEAKEDYAKYGMKVNIEALNTYLIQNVKDQAIILSSYYIGKDANFNLSEFKTYIHSIISGNDIDSNDLLTLIAASKALVKDGELAPTLNVQMLREFLDQMDRSRPYFSDLVAMRIARHHNITDDGMPSFNIINSNDIDLAASVANCIQFYINIDDLILLSISSQKQLVVEVTRELITNDKDDDQYLSLEKIFPQFKAACETLKLEPARFLIFLDKWDISEDIDKNNVKNMIADSFTLDVVFENDNDLSKHLIQSIVGYIQELEQSNWEVELIKAESIEFLMLRNLLNKSKVNVLPPNAENAYLKLLPEIARGVTTLPLELQPTWSKFYEVTNKSHLTDTLKNSRDFLLSNAPNISPEQYKFFSLMFMENGTLKGREGDFCRLVLSSMLDDELVLSTVIIPNRNYYAVLVNLSGEDSYLVKEKVRLKLVSNPEYVELIEFAKSIGIQYPPKMEETKLDEDVNDGI